MARPRKYTPEALRRAVRRYFRSITRTSVLMEPVATGQKDEEGHEIYVQQPILNDLGQVIEVTRYLLPPTIADMCLRLGIHPSTWSEWSDREKHPEYAETVEHVRQTILAWNQRELLSREGKDVRGIIFNLQANYGLSEKRETELGPRAAAVLLQMEPEIEEYGG